MKHTNCRDGFTLVELLVVIAIIGTLVGLLLPAVQSAREASRSHICRIHLTELQRALTMYENDTKHFPGYVESVRSAVQTTDLSWVAAILPYLEQQALYDQLIGREGKASTSLELLVCPSNPSDISKGPGSSYVVNAGWIQNERPHDTDDCGPVENVANGVFFDRTRGTTDIRDLRPECHEVLQDPVYQISMATVQAKGDGVTNTLMLSESLSALYWTWVGGESPNKKWDFGFCWEQPAAVAETRQNSYWGEIEESPAYRVVNGVRENLAGATLRSKPPNSAFVSSYHPSGVNVGFVGGQVRFLNEKVDAFVFAQLMTSNRKRSDLENLARETDRQARQPGAGDY